MPKLINAAFSQFGEDALMESILNKVGKNRHCLEFGAWDGITYSNSFYFIEKLDYKSILIEPDVKKYNKLLKNMSFYNSINKTICINEFVGEDPSNKLQYYLQKNNFPIDFDFISVDVDSDDLRLLLTLGKFSPKIICIEYNFTFPQDYVYVNTKAKSEGNSFAAINIVLDQLGYGLCAQTQGSLIYVQKELMQKFNIPIAKYKQIFNTYYTFSGDFRVFLDDSFLTTKVKSKELQSLIGNSYFNVPFSYVMHEPLVPKKFRKWPRNQFNFLIYSLLDHLIHFRIRPVLKYIVYIYSIIK
jgi:hypothetical protein